MSVKVGRGEARALIVRVVRRRVVRVERCMVGRCWWKLLVGRVCSTLVDDRSVRSRSVDADSSLSFAPTNGSSVDYLARKSKCLNESATPQSPRNVERKKTRRELKRKGRQLILKIYQPSHPFSLSQSSSCFPLCEEKKNTLQLVKCSFRHG